MASSTYTALSSFTTTTAPLSTANGTQNANVLLPNGNGAPAALANTAAANNPLQPPPPQAEPKPSTSTHISNDASLYPRIDCLVDLVVNWNGPGGSFSGHGLDEHFPLV
ncbi:hypothetical protein FRC18_004418 [Serendipita sp. 400]|nr:hypothetical protein FRC18_004418 [Serendipita sp. 400]